MFLIFGREKGVSPFQQDFHQDFRFFPLKPMFWNVDNIENWKRFDFTQKKVRKLKIFTPSHRKVLILEIYLKILEIWTTLPPEIQQIKFFRQSRSKICGQLWTNGKICAKIPFTTRVTSSGA